MKDIENSNSCKSGSPCESYRTHIQRVAAHMNSTLDFRYTTLKAIKVIPLLAYTGACQHVVYEYYNPGGQWSPPKEVSHFDDFKVVYKNVKEYLQTRQAREKVKEVYNRYYTEYMRGPDAVMAMYDDLFELVLMSETIPNNWVKAVHDGWALKTYFTGLAQGKLVLKRKSDAVWKNSARLAQFRHYCDLGTVDRLKDIPSAAAIRYAVGVFKHSS